MKFLIIGVSGTMGNLVLDALRKNGNNQIIGMSRDEQKIHKMPKYDNVEYVIGDIRDKSRLGQIMSRNFHTVINLAALKCVDILEANPAEAIKTNVIGSQNLVEVAESLNRPKIVFTSTDKAVYPINAYGHSKALAEAIYRQYQGACSVFRYGNILGSRGSVLHTFVNQIKQDLPLTITGIYMTRFWITSDEVCKILVNDACNLDISNNLKIIFSKTLRIFDVALAVSKIMKRSPEPKNYNVVGFRAGEKQHETLVKNSDKFIPFNLINPMSKDYTSQDYDRYSMHEFTQMIEPIVQKILAG